MLYGLTGIKSKTIFEQVKLPLIFINSKVLITIEYRMVYVLGEHRLKIVSRFKKLWRDIILTEKQTETIVCDD